MITLQQVVDKVRELAQERPNFRYDLQGSSTNECSYVAREVGSSKGVGCIVGQALMALGVEEDTLRDMEEVEGTAMVFETLLQKHLIPAGIVEPVQLREPYKHGTRLTPLVGWITAAQSGQDVGLTWSMAVAEADRKAPLTS